MTFVDYLRSEGWFGRYSGPRYIQLYRRIDGAIADGLLAPNSSLPSERELAELTEMSRATVRKAIKQLADKGKIIQRQGSGSFVSDTVTKVEQSLSNLTSFTEDMNRRGMQTRSVWIERGIFMPSTDEIMTLGIAANDSVSRIYRLREADGRPMALERASLPVDILPNPLELDGSLYQLLKARGFGPVRAVQKITAKNITATEAKLLKTKAHTAGLSILRTSYLASGRVVEMTQSIYRGDAYDFVAELRMVDYKEK